MVFRLAAAPRGVGHCATSQTVRTVIARKAASSERMMKLIKEIQPCRTAVREARQQGQRTGLVPTMGALHKGHVSLMQAARARCDFVAVTIFVNPRQFGPGADLDAYPRTLEADLAACEAAGVDVVFVPDASTIYPGGEATTVHVAGLTEGLCGAHRPGHFDGVTTVVAKLFNILPVDEAFFGEKDYQQLAVLRRMVVDLNLSVDIVGCPTIREADGLACSSRNAYLSPPERERAVCLSRALFAAVDRVSGGQRDSGAVLSAIREEIASAGPSEIDYAEIVDAVTLEVLDTVDRPARICLAVRIGSCRLIDNVGVGVGTKSER